MFGALSEPGYRHVTKKACGYDTVTQEVPVPGSKSGLTETVTTKVPRFRTVKQVVYCGNCYHRYCPPKVCCGGSGKKLRDMATAQGHSGSPNIGLVPTMKPIAP